MNIRKRTLTITATLIALVTTIVLPTLSPTTHTTAANPVLEAVRNFLINDGSDPRNPRTDPDYVSDVPSLLQSILSIAFFAVGLLAVFFIIRGAWKYTQSNGDASKIAEAKNTIMYAVFGLVFAIAAFAIVSFIFQQFRDP